ncbi:hypothetical protein PybrP1_000293 [[Pythium] brassicae (nom. inval.)]|nr:hypothetical protein PybrP1_000293 [[Pythium] brassicae (nom. inval.)]
MGGQAHGQRLACFRPQQRFCAASGTDAAADADERFEHVQHADAAGCEDDDARPALATSPSLRASASAALGRRQKKLQLRLALEQRRLEQRQVACDCEFQVFRCQLAHPDAPWSLLEQSYLARLRKWTEKFDAHDWRHERVSQKWKENQKRFVLEREELERRRRASSQDQAASAAGASTSTEPLAVDEDKLPRARAGKVVKQALSSFASAAEVLLLSRQFDSLLRAGVPPHLRGQVWWMCSGAAELQRAALEPYAVLVSRLHTLSRCASMEIEKDLPRTFPVAPGVSSDAEDRVRRSSMGELRRVLQAYSLRNPRIGYCQSMNFLAAVLLHHMEEEEAFWVLAAIVEELTPDYHTRSMAGSRADQRVFADLVQQKLPALFQHMQALGVDFEPFTLKWFLCLFLNTLPFEPVLRIWDVFFCEGSHVLLRVGLALLKLNQPRILACSDAFEVYEMFKVSHETLHELTTPHRAGLLNRDECVCDTFVRLAVGDKAFVGPIPFDSLHELRQFYVGEIEAEAAELDARRAATRAAQAATTRAASPAGSSGSDSGDAGDAAEMLEYDFLDELADDHALEISPSKYIHFRDLYDSEGDGSSDYFVDVNYEYGLCR